MSTIIHHLTLNTGHVARFDGITPADQMALMRPLIHNGGPIPNCPPYRVRVNHVQGAAEFSIYRDFVPITSNLLVWTDEAAGHWRKIEDLYLSMCDEFPDVMNANTIPQRPESLPWLATVLLPTAGFAGFDISWIGAFERIYSEAQLETAGIKRNPTRSEHRNCGRTQPPR
jgi:hypothetical protein